MGKERDRALDEVGGREGCAEAERQDERVHHPRDRHASEDHEDQHAPEGLEAHRPVIHPLDDRGGRGGDAHTTGEWYENREGTVGIGRALTIVCAMAGLE